jgi:Rho-type GTPase-activating protein 1/2
MIDCDYQCHTKCLMSVTVPCTKSRKMIRDVDTSSIASETSTLFGNDLTRQAEIEGRPIPYIVTRCIEEVEAHGMDYEGIYRKSGGASSLRAIIDAFEVGGEVNFDHLVGSGDICAVTSALKQYLRNLPDPLLPFSVYDRFLQATTGSDTILKISKFRAVLDCMPKVNYDCLQLLMLHLSRYLSILIQSNCRVVERSDVNLMHANNLAVVFSPTIMRDMTGARQIADIQATNMCVKFLIENANALFKSPKKSISLDRSGESIARKIDNRI